MLQRVLAALKHNFSIEVASENKRDQCRRVLFQDGRHESDFDSTAVVLSSVPGPGKRVRLHFRH